MDIREIKTPTDARKFLVGLVGELTSRDVDRLVGYSGWNAYKKGNCEIAAGTWFRIWNAMKK
jgi:hypothetical protein